MSRVIIVFIFAYLITLVLVPIASIRGIYRMARGDIDPKTYMMQNAYAYDKLWSASLGYLYRRFLSSIMGEKKERGHLLSCFVCKCLDFLFGQKDHCAESLAKERMKSEKGTRV